MFDLNEKIMVLASSCHKKMGPRKNSIGYITVFPTSIQVMLPLRVVTMQAHIRFLRYGNEERDRFESKQVLLLFPIFLEKDKAQDSIKTLVDRFTHDMDYNKGNSHLDEIRKGTEMSSIIPIILAAPTYPMGSSFKTCSLQEFTCWFENSLMSTQINSFINNTLTTNHFTGSKKIGISHTDLARLQQMMFDKGVRQACINSFYVDEKKRNKWITILRMITITAEQTERKDCTERLTNTIINNIYTSDTHRFGVKAAHLVLIPYIFCQRFNLYKETCVELNKFVKHIKIMEETKKAMIDLTLC